MTLQHLRTWTATMVLALVLAGPAGAKETGEDLESRKTSLAAAVKRHKAGNDFGSLKGDLDVASKLYVEAEGNKPLRGKIVALMVGIGKKSKSKDVVHRMLDALAKTGHGAAPKTIKGYLKQKKRQSAGDHLLAAMKVAEEHPHSSYVEPLLKLFLKSKHTGVAARALQTLGAYKGVKNKRQKILKALVENVRKFKPGVKGMEKGYVEGESATASGDHAKTRWQALAPYLPKALSRLTGNDMYGATADDWFTMYDDNKRSLGALFSDE